MKKSKIIFVLFAALAAAALAACGKKTTVTISAAELALEAGSSAPLTATVSDDSDVVWSSSDRAVAYWSDGAVYALSPGTAVITAAAGPASASCAVTVTAKSVETPSRAVVTLSANALEMKPGEEKTLTAAVYVNGAPTADTVTWSSSDACVTVSGSGNNATITAVAEGAAVVTAAFGEEKADCAVTVASIYAVTGRLQIDERVAVTGTNLTDATVNFDGPVERRAAVAADGAFSIELPAGAYAVTASHPRYRSVTYTAAVDGDTTLGTTVFEHYGLGETLHSNTEWTYDTSTRIVEMKRVSAANAGISVQFLADASSDRYTLEATVNAKGEQWNKFGFVYASADVGPTCVPYSIMFSPTQNEVNFYFGLGSTENKPDRKLYNGAVSAGGDLERIKLPVGVLGTTEAFTAGVKENGADKIWTMKEITVKLTRDGERLYLWVNGTFYVRVTLPADIADKAGAIGFRNQNQAEATIGNLRYDLGEQAAADALAVSVTPAPTENGRIEVAGAEKLGGTAAIGLIPSDGYELTGFTVNGENKLPDVTDNRYALTLSQPAYELAAVFSPIITRYAVSGKLSIAGEVAMKGQGAELAKAVFTDKSNGLAYTFTCDASGAFDGELPEGAYTLRYTHPSYADITADDVTLDGNKEFAARFAHYGLGVQLDRGGKECADWSYDPDARAFALSHDMTQTGQDETYAALKNTTAMRFVLNVRLRVTEQAQYNKVGLILSWPGTSVKDPVSMMFCRSQNEINFYKGGTELDPVREYFNGAKAAGNAKRAVLPSNVFFTQGGTAAMSAVRLTVARDNADVYLFVNGVKYLKATIPELLDKEGCIGFRNQNTAEAFFDELSFSVDPADVAALTASEAAFTAVGTGASVTYQGLDEQNKAAAGKNAVLVKITPEAGKAVVSARVRVNGVIANAFRTGAGFVVPVTVGGNYVVEYETAAADTLVTYAGTIDLAEYYRYDGTNNPGTHPAALDGHTGWFASGLTAGLGAIDYRELVAAFTGADGLTHYADVDENYAFSVSLPAGTYDYTVYDVDYLGYYLAGAGANPTLFDYVSRLAPAKGTVTVEANVSDAIIALGELGYNGGRFVYASGKGIAVFCANANPHVKDGEWRGFKGNHYVGASEPVLMASLEAPAGAEVKFALNGDTPYFEIKIEAGGRVSSTGTFTGTAVTAVRNAAGTDKITLVRQGAEIKVFVNDRAAGTFTGAQSFGDYYLALAVNAAQCKNLYTTTNTALIAAAAAAV